MQDIKDNLMARFRRGEKITDESIAFLEHPKASEWYQRFFRLKILEGMLEGLEFEEIIFHHPDNIQIISHDTRMQTTLNITEEEWQLLFEVLCDRFHQEWNFAHPFVSFHCEINKTKLRATLIHHHIGHEQVAKLFLRKISLKPFPLKSFYNDVLDEQTLSFIFEEKMNGIICGATGSGKTSFMNSFLNHYMNDEHVVVLEDVHEIYTESQQFTHLLSQKDNERYSLKEYCSYALRLRPDRLILGEMRSHEVIPFILSMNTGHKGLLTTLHANNAIDAISRIKTLFSIYSPHQIEAKALNALLSGGIDFILYMENKKPKELVKIMGHDQENIYFDQF